MIKIPIERIEPCILPGNCYLACTNLKVTYVMVLIEIEYQLKVLELKNTWYIKVNYEHIAYELRYEI